MRIRSRRSTGAAGHRGQALPLVLWITLALTMLIAAAQLQVTAQFRLSKTERDGERALQAAETGANWFLNQLSNGATPPPIQELSLSQFGQQVRAKTIRLTVYPAGSQSGYYVGYTGQLGTRITLVAYGWSNGVVRRVKVRARAFSAFDMAAVYTINPSLTPTGALDETGNNFSLKFAGGGAIIGTAGSEGQIQHHGSSDFYNAAVLLAGPYARFSPNSDPTVSAINGGTVPDPTIRRYPYSLGIPTADESANQISHTRQGVEYFRTHNDNRTGFRYLVQDKNTGVIRELPGNYSVLGPGEFTLDSALKKDNQVLNSLGMAPSENFYGLRVYPGNYYLEQIQMRGQDRLLLRTFTNGERSSLGRNGDPANPNPGQGNNPNVRFWIGHSADGSDPTSTFTDGTQMEAFVYSSRFRVYVASYGGVSMTGAGASASDAFNVNLLVYNRDASGNGYGFVQFTGNNYLKGSIICWQLHLGGGSFVEKGSFEQGPEDRLIYTITDWTELP